MKLAGLSHYFGFPVVFLSDNHQRIILPVPFAIIKLPMLRWALDVINGSISYPDRPSTHQLLISIIQLIGGHVKGVLIDQLHGGFYLSKIMIELEGCACEFSSEASDAIIIAVILGQSILVSDLMIDRQTFRLDEHGRPEWPISGEELDRLQRLAED